MSKTINDGLTRSGTGCFIVYPYDNRRHQREQWHCHRQSQQRAVCGDNATYRPWCRECWQV